MDNKYKVTNEELTKRQNMCLSDKIEYSLKKIEEFYKSYDGKVYISFSGGKDSTVLLDLVRSKYPNVEAVFIDTGLEYPEIKEFVKTINNVTTIRPKISFIDVLRKYGYPVISKKVAGQIECLKNPTKNNINKTNLINTGITSDGRIANSFKISKKWKYLINSPFKISNRCCDVMKKEPIHRFEKVSNKHPFVGIMATDSLQRRGSYLKTGCNNYDKQLSTPLAFWNEKDIWDYILLKNLSYSKVYDMGLKRTGCMFCMFGINLEKSPNRFQLMKMSHPQIYDYCLNKLNLKEILDYIKVKYE